MVPKPRLSPFPGQVPRDALGCPRAQSRVFPHGQDWVQPGAGVGEVQPGALRVSHGRGAAPLPVLETPSLG